MQVHVSVTRVCPNWSLQAVMPCEQSSVWPLSFSAHFSLLSSMLHLRSADKVVGIEEYRYRHITPPKEVDWRKSGVVGPVKDQHVNGAPCGCCWAFATTG